MIADAELLSYLTTFLTDERTALYDKILQSRTNYLTVVLEDIFQPHNASAVVRTCDCFGIQNLHIIENRNQYDINPDIVVGANQWVNLHKYNKTNHNTAYALEQLKNQGYRIVATEPHAQGVALHDFDLSKGKTALIFGTEREGISNVVKEMADEYLYIPMYGFTESLNISVSVAIIAQYLKHQLEKSDLNWKLTEKELIEQKLTWIRENLKSAHLIEANYIKQKTLQK